MLRVLGVRRHLIQRLPLRLFAAGCLDARLHRFAVGAAQTLSRTQVQLMSALRVKSGHCVEHMFILVLSDAVISGSSPSNVVQVRLKASRRRVPSYWDDTYRSNRPRPLSSARRGRFASGP